MKTNKEKQNWQSTLLKWFYLKRTQVHQRWKVYTHFQAQYSIDLKPKSWLLWCTAMISFISFLITRGLDSWVGSVWIKSGDCEQFSHSYFTLGQLNRLLLHALEWRNYLTQKAITEACTNKINWGLLTWNKTHNLSVPEIHGI